MTIKDFKLPAPSLTIVRLGAGNLPDSLFQARRTLPERHAEAESSAADNGAEPTKIRRQIDRLINVDSPAEMQRMRSDDRDGNRQHPGSESQPIAHQDKVRDSTHRAEVRALRRGPKNYTDDKTTDADDRRYCKLTHRKYCFDPEPPNQRL